jgi:hypothetical protein
MWALGTLALLLGVVLGALAAPGYADLLDADNRYTNPNYGAGASAGFSGFNPYVMYSVDGLVGTSNNTAGAAGPWSQFPGSSAYPNRYIEYWKESGFTAPPSTVFFNYGADSLVLFFLGVIIIV